MDARRILAEQTFDMIGAFDVIEHIAEDEEVMRSAHRALRLGGGVMIAVPQHPWLWSSTDDAAYHVRRYRRGEMEEKLDRNGFRVVFSGSYCTFLLPLMIASRWLDRLRRKSDKASTVSEVRNAAVGFRQSRADCWYFRPKSRPPSLARASLWAAHASWSRCAAEITDF